jgi:phosphonate transport system substrate-binding protein
MKRLLMLMLLCGVIGVAPAQTESTSSTKPLRVGLLPYLSTEKLLMRFAPLKAYLESSLHRPVILETAPNFESYIDRAGHYQYDLYLAAPHIAALAETDFHYRRVSRLMRELHCAIVVRNDGSVKSLKDLRGRIVTTPSDTAIVTMLGEKLLSDNKLVAGKNITVEHTPSHNNAIIAVANGRADAAMTSAAVFETMPKDVRDRLDILITTEKVPHMMFMASPKLPEAEYQELTRVMLLFTAAGPGKEFFQSTGYGDMGKITDQKMKQLSPYVKTLKQRIKK